jgi:hypothetical protein
LGYYSPETTEDDRAELLEVVESITFVPPGG